jgi:hypothetical protein
MITIINCLNSELSNDILVLQNGPSLTVYETEAVIANKNKSVFY